MLVEFAHEIRIRAPDGRKAVCSFDTPSGFSVPVSTWLFTETSATFPCATSSRIQRDCAIGSAFHESPCVLWSSHQMTRYSCRVGTLILARVVSCEVSGAEPSPYNF